jgi:hypothetical protein
MVPGLQHRLPGNTPFSARILCIFFPHGQSGAIGRDGPKGKLDGGPAEIRRHLWKTDIKIKAGLVLFRRVDQMLRFIEPAQWSLDPDELFPDTVKDSDQI